MSTRDWLFGLLLWGGALLGAAVYIGAWWLVDLIRDRQR